ncbi:MAG TPA: type II secretion system protein [Burkholderiales bacterium]
MSTRPANSDRGFSLVELILAITVIGISMAAVMTVFVVTTQHSADPMARQQAQLIAEAYLDEILIKKFYDPDTNNVCPSPEGSRSAYDNVCDYNSLPDTVVRDQFGTAIAALSAYNAQVSVSDGAVSLNGIDNTSVIRLLLVTVTVTGPNSTSVTLNAYRTNYQCNASGDTECKPH